MKRIICSLVAFILIISLAACSKVPQPLQSETELPTEPAPVTESDDIPEPEPEPESEPEPEIPLRINPLTGEEIDEDVSANRPVAFMINNISVAQPQLGVGNADIIYEALVEGGITRMMAVFQTLPNDISVGSIRSCRHNYIDFAAIYDAIYIHAGASDIGYDALEERNTDHVDALLESNAFYRDEQRKASMGFEHSLCCKTTDLNRYLSEQTKFSTKHHDRYKCNMKFSDVPAFSGANAEKVTVSFGKGNKTTQFTYSSETGKYTAEQFGSTYCDGNSDEIIDFKNIVVIKTDVETIDDKGHQNMTITGTGSGYFIRDGKCAEITWTREDQNAQFVYTLDDGSEILYGIGRTYVGIISMSGSLAAN